MKPQPTTAPPRAAGELRRQARWENTKPKLHHWTRGQWAEWRKTRGAGEVSSATAGGASGGAAPAPGCAGEWRVSAGRGRAKRWEEAEAVKRLGERIWLEQWRLERRDAAARRLQAAVRGFLARREAASQTKERAARRVQAWARACIARRAAAAVRGGERDPGRVSCQGHAGPEGPVPQCGGLDDNAVLAEAMAVADSEREELHAALSRTLKRLKVDSCRSCGAMARPVDPAKGHCCPCRSCGSMPVCVAVACASKKCSYTQCLPCGGSLLRMALQQELSEQWGEEHLSRLFHPPEG